MDRLDLHALDSFAAVARHRNLIVPVVSLVVLVLYFGIRNPAFLSVNSAQNIARQIACLSILAMAGTLGAWLGGKLDDHLGPKRVIVGSMTVLLLAVIAILLVDKDSILFVKVAPPVPGGALYSGAAERAYLVLGCLIGAAGGPLQAASRTLLIHMAPKDRVAQYFGLFALTGKVTSFVGPLLIGVITAVTESQKAGMAVVVVFFVAGLALLARVGEDRAG